MVFWESIPGETPIDPSGLKRRGSITNRRELVAAEATNMNRAFLKYLASKPSSRSAPFDLEWFLKLHREMFHDVWNWAGVVRTRVVNLGVTHIQIIEQLAALVGDLHGEPIVAWPDQLLGVASVVRDEYLVAVRAADRGDYDGLTGLHRRFTEGG